MLFCRFEGYKATLESKATVGLISQKVRQSYSKDFCTFAPLLKKASFAQEQHSLTANKHILLDK